jgi:hypothetical protein
VSNQTIHVDLHVPFIKYVIQEKSKKHHVKLGHHSNAILQPLLAEQQRRSYIAAPTGRATKRKVEENLASRPN